jgi:hypothetical protein
VQWVVLPALLLLLLLLLLLQVSRAAFDSSTGKWLLEGAVRSPARTRTDIKQLPPYTPWNLGVFDALVLADKMVGIPGKPGRAQGQQRRRTPQSSLAAVCVQGGGKGGGLEAVASGVSGFSDGLLIDSSGVSGFSDGLLVDSSGV